VKQGDTVVLVKDDPVAPPDLGTIPRTVVSPELPVRAAAVVPITEPVMPPPVQPPPLTMKSNVRPAVLANRPPAVRIPPPAVGKDVVPKKAPKALPRAVQPTAGQPTASQPTASQPTGGWRPMPAGAPMLPLGTLAQRTTVRSTAPALLPAVRPTERIPSPPPQRKRKVVRPPTRGTEIMRTLMDQIRKAPTPEARVGIITKFAQKDFEQLDPRAQNAILELRRRVGEGGLAPGRVEAQERRVIHAGRGLVDLENEVRARDEALHGLDDRVTHLRTQAEHEAGYLRAHRTAASQLDADLSTEEDRLHELERAAGDISRASSGLDLSRARKDIIRSKLELSPLLSRRDVLRNQIKDMQSKVPSPKSIEDLRKSIADEQQKLSDTQRELADTISANNAYPARKADLKKARIDANRRAQMLRNDIGTPGSKLQRDTAALRTKLLNQQKQFKLEEQSRSALTARKKSLEDRIRDLNDRLSVPNVSPSEERDRSDFLARELESVNYELEMVNSGREKLSKIQDVRSERAKVDEELNHYRSNPRPDYRNLDEELRTLEQQIRDEDERGRELDEELRITREFESLSQELGRLKKEEEELRSREEHLIKGTQNIANANQGVKAGRLKYNKEWLDWARVSNEPSETERKLSSELQKLRSAPRPDISGAKGRIRKLQLELGETHRKINKREQELNDLIAAKYQSAATRKYLAKRISELQKYLHSGRKKRKKLAHQITNRETKIEDKISFLESEEKELLGYLDEIERMINTAVKKEQVQRLKELQQLFPARQTHLHTSTPAMSPSNAPSIPDDYLDNMRAILERNYPNPIKVTPEFQRKLNKLGLFDANLYFHYIQGAARMLRINPQDWQLRDASFRFPPHVPIPEADGLRDFKFKKKMPFDGEFLGLNELPFPNAASRRFVSNSGTSWEGYHRPEGEPYPGYHPPVPVWPEAWNRPSIWSGNMGSPDFEKYWRGRLDPFSLTSRQQFAWKHLIHGVPPTVEVSVGNEFRNEEYVFNITSTVIDSNAAQSMYFNRWEPTVDDVTNKLTVTIHDPNDRLDLPPLEISDDKFFTVLDTYALHEVASPMARAHWLSIVNQFFRNMFPITSIKTIVFAGTYKPETRAIGSFHIYEKHTNQEDDFPEAAEALRRELQKEVDEFRMNPNAGLLEPLFPPIPVEGLPRINALMNRIQDLNRQLGAAIHLQTDQRERQVWTRVYQNVGQNLVEIQRAMRDGNINKAYSLLMTSGQALEHLRFRGG
jgi:hypothetical protein